MSNLLEKASIIHVPAGYDVGSINAVKPNLNLSEELIVNGDFATNSDWRLGDGWSISNGKATSSIGWNNQTLRKLYNIGISGGKTYRVKFDVLDYVSGSFRVFLGDNGQSTSKIVEGITANGSYSYDFTSPFGTGGDLIFRNVGTDTSFSIDNVSVKEILPADFYFDRGTGGSVQSRVKGNQTIVFPQIETPRLDYTGGTGHWLIEPTSTNLITYSADFEQSNWGITNEITITDGFSSPDGGNNASKISTDPQASQATKGLLFDGYNGTNRLTDSRSIWAKTVSGTGQLHLLSHHNNADNLFTITEEWQRFDLTGYISQGAHNFYAVDFRGSSTLTEVYLWGGQAEDNPFTTSYIPTSGGTATRDTEVASGSGDSTMFNDDEGVLYAEIAALSNDQTERSISLASGANNDRITLQYNLISNNIQCLYRVGNANVGDVSFTSSDITNFSKIAFKYKTNDFALWVDGVEVDTDPNGTTQNLGLIALTLDRLNSNSSPFYGKIKCIAVFKEALTDSELQCLTT